VAGDDLLQSRVRVHNIADTAGVVSAEHHCLDFL
jgi:hypothetical protein